VEACRRRRTGKERLCVHPGEPGRNGSRRSRFCPDFARLGLLRPSPAEAERLVTAAVGGLQTTDRPGPLIAELRALPAELTEAQASQALEPVLERIGQAPNYYSFESQARELQAQAKVLQALAAKLTDAQAAQASKAAAASLAWAADDEEATEWARALAALSRPAVNRDGMLVTAIAFPAAAGSATEVLLDAIRGGNPDAPAKEKGTAAALEWLTKAFPVVLRPPICPKPLQADLKCPAQDAPATPQ
jgi:hypothetical protein